MTEQIRVGLIGFGFAGRAFHAPVITSVPGLLLSKVVERRSEKSKERYPWVDVVNSVEALFEDKEIDLVVVTTPSTDHYSFVRDALLAGKHVVVEKPFTPTSKEAEELIALAKRQGRMLSVFHNRRWDGDFLTLKQMISQGLLGDIVECEFHWDRFIPVVNTSGWREQVGPGTGILYDLGSHFIDQVVQLFGVPETITGDVRIVREGGEADDYFDVELGYPNPLKVILKSSKLVREPGPRYIVHGSKGSWVKYGIDPQEAALIAGNSPSTESNWGKESREWWGKLNTTVGDLHVEGTVETMPGSYTSYYDNIYRHLTEKAELAVMPEEAMMTIRLIELAYKSHREGRTIRVGEERDE